MPDPQETASALWGDPDPWISSPLMKTGGAEMGNALMGVASNIASIPQRAFESSEALRNTGQYNPEPVMQAAQLLMGGGMPAAEAGAAGIFGGKLARTGNPAKLMQANIMEMKGADQLETYWQTGWFRGADGQWRFEIPDNEAKAHVPDQVLAAIRNDTPWEPNRLGDVLHHPALYEAYPKLSNMEVGWGAEPGAGSFTPASKSEPAYMQLSPYDSVADQTSVALHEAQHAVQARELFSPGSSPSVMREQVIKELQKQIPDFGNKSFAGTEFLENIINRRAKAKYKSTAGEVEARNVQHRQPFVAGTRVLRPPWRTEDTPRISQTVLPPERYYP